ncbi:MAG: dephospho-CoA kinase [Synergistaceae bacterium]|nr:dephospho-CoA kinase [Synergistaceae bacterium]
MAVVAITGDIGAGKSTAAKLLAEKFACPVLNADEIAADLWRSDERVKFSAVSRWGNEILDTSGNIIKSEISRRIFFDRNDYEFCNLLLHPIIMRELGARSEEAGGKNLVLEIPLIFEAGRPEFVDEVVYVAADFEVRARRCHEQRGWDADELRRRESFLLPRDEKISQSDFIITNNGTLSELQQKIGELFT